MRRLAIALMLVPSIAEAQSASNNYVYDTTTSSTSTSTNTNNNSNTSTSTSTNTNVNQNINSGTLTNVNQNTSTSANTNTNVNTDTSVSTVTQTVNQNTSTTNHNVNTDTSTVNQTVNQNTTSANSNVNQNNNVNVSDSTSYSENVSRQVIDQNIKSPPPSAIAPSMMSYSQDLCTTGMSGAVQTQILGISAGKTVHDQNCERIKLSKTLYDMGMRVAAVSLLCQDDRVFRAMEMAGTPCPFMGLIGANATEAWAENPEKRPDAKSKR